MITKAK